MRAGGGRSRRAVRVTVVALMLLLPTACTSRGGVTPAAQAAGASTSSGSSGAETAAAGPVTVTTVPADTSTDVPLGSPVMVSATHGRLTSVIVVDDKARPVEGRTLSGDTVWHATASLRAAQHYRVTAVTVDGAGEATTTTSTFATVAPRTVLTTSISPIDGELVGVGMPIVVNFNAPVQDRAAVERVLVVTASKAVPGSWSWISDTEVHYRPMAYWPTYDDITLEVGLQDVDAGGGVYGISNHTVAFRTGSSIISTVDVRRHTLTVRRNGTVTRVIPVTTGKADFLTRNGVKVVLEKSPLVVMDATTVGIAKGSPDYYKLDVPFAMRVTWSGEFVHAAPWSTGSQGRANVSHGCVGMSMTNASWLFRQTTVGDIVQVVGSPRRLEPGNGWTDWNVDWTDWVAGSALRS